MADINELPDNEPPYLEFQVQLDGFHKTLCGPGGDIIRLMVRQTYKDLGGTRYAAMWNMMRCIYSVDREAFIRLMAAAKLVTPAT